MLPNHHHDTNKKDDLDAPIQDSPYRRSRQWECRHLDEKVVYRGVHPGYARDVKRLAADLHVPQGEVACSLLEYSLLRYEQGFLDLVPRPHPKCLRMTLLPPLKNRRRKNMKRKSKSSIQEETSWRNITTWRNFSPETKRTISALTSEEALNVPVGQLVNALLRHGLQAHKAGFLKLEPAEVETVLTQLGEGEA